MKSDEASRRIARREAITESIYADQTGERRTTLADSKSIQRLLAPLVPHDLFLLLLSQWRAL